MEKKIRKNDSSVAYATLASESFWNNPREGVTNLFGFWSQNHYTMQMPRPVGDKIEPYFGKICSIWGVDAARKENWQPTRAVRCKTNISTIEKTACYLSNICTSFSTGPDCVVAGTGSVPGAGGW